nr:MAK10-like protein [Tanacetum cinerariifolium]
MLETTPDLATRAIETPLSSPMGTLWCLCDLTPLCKTDAGPTDFDSRIQTNILSTISTSEDLTTCFLAQFFPPGRTVKIQNVILIFQQHQALLAPKSSLQVNKIAFSWEICSGPHDTQYCMENPEQAFVDFASSRNKEMGDQPEEEDIMETNAAKGDDHSLTIRTEEEVEEESEESNEETEKEEEDDP